MYANSEWQKRLISIYSNTGKWKENGCKLYAWLCPSIKLQIIIVFEYSYDILTRLYDFAIFLNIRDWVPRNNASSVQHCNDRTGRKIK